MIEYFQLYGNEFLLLAGSHLVAVASPGPDFTIVTKNTLRYGKQAGTYTALGVAVAILLHVTYAVLGFSLLVRSSPTLFHVMQWAGALFLFYLGIKSLLAKPVQLNQSKQEKTIRKQAWMQGFLTNAFNIKALLFFLFLFTSIVHKNTPLEVKIIYGLWLSIATFLWFALLANIMSRYSVRAFYQNYGIWLDRLMGVILVYLALRLII